MWYVITYTIGFISGLVFYSKVLDKPESVQSIKKQKIRKGGFIKNIFNRKKRNNNV